MTETQALLDVKKSALERDVINSTTVTWKSLWPLDASGTGESNSTIRSQENKASVFLCSMRQSLVRGCRGLPCCFWL